MLTITKDSIINCPCGCGYQPQRSILWFLDSLGREYQVQTGKLLHVNSGARCYRHNIDVGGVKNSAHVHGLAMDVHFDNSHEAYIILQHLYKLGVPRIGIDFTRKFIHFDVDKSLPQNVLFKY